MITNALYLDELKENQVVFRFERGYKRFQTYYNKEFLGEVSGLATLKKGMEYETSDGHTISVKISTGNDKKSFFDVEYNGIPVPTSPRYPMKVLKRAGNWVLAFSIIILLFVVPVVIQFPAVLSVPLFYIIPGIACALIALSIMIKKLSAPALYISIVLFSIELLLTFTNTIEFLRFTGILHWLGIILKAGALFTLIKAIKPMKQMQVIKRRMQGKMSGDVIDDATF